MNEVLRGAIKELFGEYAKDVEKSIYYFCYSNQSKFKIHDMDQDDIAQELLIKTATSIDKYDTNRKFMPFINTVLRRHLISIWRKGERSNDVYTKLGVYEIRDDDY